jgi:DNA-binding XRE family transcriptional regulator
MMDWKKFGRDVKAARTAANLTLREAAPLAGINYAVWHRLEHGRRLTNVLACLLICRWMEADPFKYLRE